MLLSVVSTRVHGIIKNTTSTGGENMFDYKVVTLLSLLDVHLNVKFYLEYAVVVFPHTRNMRSLE